MSWAITSAVITLAGTAYSADASRKAGKQQKYDLERQAEQETIAAQGQELQRREKLNKVLAANIAMASNEMTGIGSPESIALASAKRMSTSEGAESLSDRLRRDMLKRQGRTAQKIGNTQAASTLLSGGIKAAQLAKQ